MFMDRKERRTRFSVESAARLYLVRKKDLLGKFYGQGLVHKPFVMGIPVDEYTFRCCEKHQQETPEAKFVHIASLTHIANATGYKMKEILSEVERLKLIDETYKRLTGYDRF